MPGPIRRDCPLRATKRAVYPAIRVARLNAYLDDYACLINAILALLQARWNSTYLACAHELADRLLQHFEDPQHGGFFFTSDDDQTLIHRPKSLGDDAMPSGNGVAIVALQTLAQLLGKPALQAAADGALSAAWPAISEAPYAHVGLLEGLYSHLDPPAQLIIRGHDPELTAWVQTANSTYEPGRRVFAITLAASQLSPILAEEAGVEGQTLAYRCRGNHCEPPLSSPESL